MRIPWTARRTNQSILKEINPEYLSEGVMLKLKLQYFGHLMKKANLLEKTLMLGKIEGKGKGGSRKQDDWMAQQLNGNEFEQALEMVKDREVWHAAVHGVAKSWTLLSN